jgi:hypothetical protein
MNYKEAKQKFIELPDYEWKKICNNNMWNEWEQQIRENEREKIMKNLKHPIK